MITEMLEIGSGRRERREEDRRKIAALHANEGEEGGGGKGGGRAATCQLDGIQFRATKQTTTIRWDHGRQGRRANTSGTPYVSGQAVIIKRAILIRSCG